MCCWSPELAAADAVSYRAVVEGRQRRWQAPDVPFLGFLVSGSSLQTDYLRTAPHTCKAWASQVSTQAGAAVVLGCLSVESLHLETAAESAAAAAGSFPRASFEWLRPVGVLGPADAHMR